ncbi:YkvA family protein [Micromonospora phytophila]|uniref:YkvA family protein n=1 Tax=Micromonospora phytophila TaxID=709888 RepID=UPI0025486E20|nr:YkvA family protein [Micromonospora phytophila]
MSREAWIIVGIVAVATLVGAVLLAVRVVRTRRLLGTLGVHGKVAFYGALLYTVLPVDLIPDPIYLDDMAVLTGALLYLGRLVRQRRAAHRPLPGQPDNPPDPDRVHRPVP